MASETGKRYRQAKQANTLANTMTNIETDRETDRAFEKGNLLSTSAIGNEWRDNGEYQRKDYAGK